MNTDRLRSKRFLIPTFATVVALGAGGVVWASTASADLPDGERDRVAAAAVEAAGGGEVIEVEATDDVDEAYEVDLRRDDGSVIEVTLDDQLAAIDREVEGRDDRDDRDDGDDRDDRDDDGRDDRDDRDDGDRDGRDDRDDGDRDGRDDRETDDRALAAAERDRAVRAAVAAVGGGTATEVEGSDDPGEAYEVEVRGTDGNTWDLKLDSGFTVVRKTLDND